MNWHIQDNNKKIPKDVDSAFLLWNKNYQIKILMVLNNTSWQHQIKLAKP